MKNLNLLLLTLTTPFACVSIEANPIVPVNNVIYMVQASSPSIKADGKSSVEISVELPITAVESLAVVKLSTSVGSFNRDSLISSVDIKSKLVNVNGVLKRIASATLTSSKKNETAKVNASVENYESSTSVLFEKAYPEKLVIEPNTSVVRPKLKSEVELSVLLTRSTGTPSIGNVVKLTVVDKNNQLKGNFRIKQDHSDSSGKTYFKFNLPEDYEGLLTFEASADDGIGGTIKSDKIIIYSIKE